MNSKRKKLGLALGSGSFRGFAHIGVIKSLEKHNIPIDYVAGSSAGAMVGAVYCFNKLDTFTTFIQDANWKKFLKMIDINLKEGGLIDGDKIIKLFESWFENKLLENTNTPLSVVTTNILTGEEKDFSEGELGLALKASFALPGIFTPTIIDGNYYVDGGVVNPVPINVVRKMGADIVLAVNLNHDIIQKTRQGKKNEIQAKSVKNTENYLQKIMKRWSTRNKTPNITEMLYYTMNIWIYKITEYNLTKNPADIVIKPELGHFGPLDFRKVNEAIDEGYQKTEMIIPQLKKLMNLN